MHKEIKDAVDTANYRNEDNIKKVLEVVATQLELEMQEYWGCIPFHAGSEDGDKTLEECYNHAIQRCIVIVKKVLA